MDIPRTSKALVIPCFRESARLPATLDALVGAGLGSDQALRLIVVDDGSGPREQDALEQACAPFRDGPFAGRFEVLRLPVNRGKGGAIRAGWEAAPEADRLAFLDADGAVAAADVVRLFAAAEREPGVALFASRVRMLGRKVDRSWRRHLLGRVFASLVGTLICREIYDSQCGFKIVPGAVYRRVAPRLRESGFAFDVELLAALLDAGCSVKEMPVDWSDVPGSKVRLLRDPLAMALAVWRIARRR